MFVSLFFYRSGSVVIFCLYVENDSLIVRGCNFDGIVVFDYCFVYNIYVILFFVDWNFFRRRFVNIKIWNFNIIGFIWFVGYIDVNIGLCKVVYFNVVDCNILIVVLKSYDRVFFIVVWRVVNGCEFVYIDIFIGGDD